MLSVRRASSWAASALLLSITLASQVHAMPVIGELQRLQTAHRQDDSSNTRAEPTSIAQQSSATEARKPSSTSSVEPSGANLLRLDQQTLILVVAGFAAALSLMARLR
jgi:hypothetical protein